MSTPARTTIWTTPIRRRFGRLRNKDTAQFVGPQPSCAVYREQGIESGRIVPAWPDCAIEFRDVTVHGTFALPTDDTDLNHMGYVFRFGNGPAIYVTGDTDYSELLFAAAKHKPDLAISCINGGFNNLSHFEAAQVMSHIKPQGRHSVPLRHVSGHRRRSAAISRVVAAAGAGRRISAAGARQGCNLRALGIKGNTEIRVSDGTFPD